MHTISIDIETFSSSDLSKCGVYKYVQAPDFDILLFGYAVDGGAVKVVDLVAGEEIPENVLKTKIIPHIRESSIVQSFR